MSFVRHPLLACVAIIVLVLTGCGQAPPIETSILPPANESPTAFSNLQVESAQAAQTETPTLAPTAPQATTLPTATLPVIPTIVAPVSATDPISTSQIISSTTPAAASSNASSTTTSSCFGSINGSVVTDLNSNGQAESGEPGVMGAKLFLYNSAGVVGLYTTGNGQFYFPGLVAGKYTLTAAPPVGYTPSGPPSYDIEIKCDETKTQNILLVTGTAAQPTPTITATPTSKSRVTPVANQQGTPRASKSGATTSNFKPFTVAAVYDIAGCGTINAPGLWRLAVSLSSQWDCIQISSDNVIFDCQGNALNGKDMNGYGVVVHQVGNVLNQRPARNIEIRNCKSNTHKYGLFIDAADNLYVHDNTFNDNYRDTDDRNFGQFLGLAEGGGMRLGSTTNALIENNQTNGSAIGIDVRNSSGLALRGNTANGNTAWGIHLYNVQFSEVSDNTTNDNLRYCAWGNGTVGPGCDAGGIMLQSGSSKNVVKNNTISGSNGNGIFIKAHGTPCGDGNEISGNTISGSLYNAVELSFCKDNKIVGNHISTSLDGIWLGFAQNNELVGNDLHDLANHGIISWNSSDNNISTNTIVNSREGLYFYSSDYDKEQFFFVQGTPEDHTSRGNCLCDNTITGNIVAAIHLNNSLRNQITENRLTNNGTNFMMEGNTAGNIIENNVIEGGSYNIDDTPRTMNVSFTSRPSALTVYDWNGKPQTREQLVQALMTKDPHDSFDLYWFKAKLRFVLGLGTGE